jgi:MSHA biogenesis protein MshJ
MKEYWTRIAERVDAASLRERAMIFSAAALLLVAALYSMLVAPELVRERAFSRDVARMRGETVSIQNELQKLALARQADPDRERRRGLEALRKQIAEVEGAIVAEQKRFTAPEQIHAVLEQMLSRNRRLTLVDLKTLPAASLAETRPGEGKPAAARAPAAAERQIYRHGVEITVNGGYFDLLAYLTDLERLPTQMYWGALELSVAEHPSITLKLTVYTLSLDRAWMVV